MAQNHCGHFGRNGRKSHDSWVLGKFGAAFGRSQAATA